MKQKENLLKNISLSVINRWIRLEPDETKKELFRCYKSDKIKSTSPKMGEIIKVIKQNHFMNEGFSKYSQNLTHSIENNTIKLERSYAEFDERYRQIICNALLITKLPNGSIQFGFLQRNRGYTEKSLIGTLGMVGGHLNEADDTLYSGLIRETSEEIKGISFETSRIEPIGYIKEVSKSISNYHLCVLYGIYIDSSSINEMKSREVKEKLIWMSKDRIEAELNKTSDESIFDSWCKLALENKVNNLLW